MNIYDVIKKPLITEKTTLEKDAKNIVAVVVHPHANKIQIKQAAEKLFKVDVKAVRTANMAGKVKRTGRNIGKRSNWKKAYISLNVGSNIDFFEL
jgi:large subunit ribosomal protein L23